MTETPAVATTPFWRWPRKWLKDEKFWFDVATRTMSTIIFGLVVYGAGIATGFFQFPGVGRVTLSIVAVLLALIFGLATVLLWAFLWNKLYRRFTNYFAHRLFDVVGIGLVGVFMWGFIYLGYLGLQLAILWTP